MSKHAASGRIGSELRANRTKKPVGCLARRLGFESLELRRLLTVAAPTLIQFEPQTGQGTATLTSANNSSTSKELQFLVSGVAAGDTVNVYADGSSTAIGTATVAASATTVTVTTSGNNTLQDGAHTFTATQTDTSSNVSASSPPGASVQVFAGLTLTQTAVSATVGKPFSYTAQTNAPSGDTATIAAGTTLLPSMTFNKATQTFSGWTPTSAEAGTTQSFTATLTDTLGNSTTVSVFVAVAGTSGVSVLAPPTSIAIGSPVLVALNSADSGTPNFKVTTSSSSDPKGSDLTATLMPQSNQVLQIVTNQGVMDFQLLNNYTPNTVAHFVNLIDSGTYTSTSFYRIIAGFMSQGGVSARLST